MSQPDEPPPDPRDPPPAKGKGAVLSREARLAAALRSNIARRKAQGRQRAVEDDSNDHNEMG